MENEMKNDKRDLAKEKIILFVIGVLVGAVISTAAFFVYTKTLGTNASGSSSQQIPGGTPPEMPSGSNSGQGGIPPEMPSDSSSSSSNNSSN